MSEEKNRSAATVGVRLVKAANPPAPAPVAKSDKMTNIPPESESNAGTWLEHPINFDGLEIMVSNSTIVPQCIQAYKNNVTGFGIEIDYRDEFKQWDEDEHPELVEEYNKVQRILDLLSFDCSAYELFGKIIATRERFGIAYVEVLRNMAGEVVELNNIRRPATITMTNPLDPYVPVVYYYKGEDIVRYKRFRMYRQMVNGKTIYFKEFGDPRIMDLRNGRYLDKGEKLDLEYQANELLAIPLGDKPYGEVRWIGQVMSMAGARKAESLNANYFDNGRHTPMMIMIEGGTLSDESFAKLQEYMEGIKGENGQHAFMVLETETKSTVHVAGMEDEHAPKITVKDLSPMLQKDELFQSYIDNARRKVQSAFQLPDLYVGYTTDFNRATAQTAVETTEKQVFIPIRQELAWIINRKLLADYRLNYVEVGFRAPDVTNPEDQAKILTIVERAGGMTPNEAHRLMGTIAGETAEDFNGEWAEMPLAVQKAQKEAQSAQQPAGGAPTQVSEEVLDQIDERIEKALAAQSEDIVAVMKQIRAALVEYAGGGKDEA